MNSHTPELLPCPFCGGDDVRLMPPTARVTDEYNAADRLFPIVRCMGCFAEVPGAGGDFKGDSVRGAWNRRAAIRAATGEQG